MRNDNGFIGVGYLVFILVWYSWSCKILIELLVNIFVGCNGEDYVF